MTHLLSWRNMEGGEENWSGSNRSFNNLHFIARVVTTEIGLGILAVTAAVESVAYSALFFVTLALSPINNEPHAAVTQLLSSSVFSVIWSVTDLVAYNLFVENMLTQESLARQWAHEIYPTQLTEVRFEDELYIADWSLYFDMHRPNFDPQLQPLLAAGQATQDRIHEGARFLAEEVVTQETKTLFEEADPAIYMYILTKAVHIYACGAKRNEPIPYFFKHETQVLLTIFRSEFSNEAQLEPMPATLAEFELVHTPQFLRLQSIAAGELQNSLLVTRCWQSAIERLQLNP
jgi:hypothetical protein